MLKYPIVSVTFIILTVIFLLLGFGIFWITSLFLMYIGLIAYGSSRINSGYFLNVISGGKSREKRVVLTFDDGPHKNTPQILNFLNQKSIKGAFFCIGRNVRSYPDIAKRISNEGHVLANHSYFHHGYFPLKCSDKIHKEITETQLIIEKTTGLQSLFFRPPFGVTNPMIAKAVKKSGLIPIGWSIRSFDLSGKSDEEIVFGIMKRLKGDDIVLLHDKSDKALDILEQLYHQLKEKGWEIVPLETLLAQYNIKQLQQQPA